MMDLCIEMIDLYEVFSLNTQVKVGTDLGKAGIFRNTLFTMVKVKVVNI